MNGTKIEGMISANGKGVGRWYLPYLLSISGFGGLLAGVDFGIIASALLYLDKTISLTEAELSFVVAIYTGGGMIASLLAGAFADWMGRKIMMVAGGLMFVISIFLIYSSQGLVPLVFGRILMGLSGGVICVVVPLYMAECLPSRVRGRGTSIFQFMLTAGIAAAAAIGLVFASWHDQAIKEAAGDAIKILAADNAAWRSMFLIASIPGIFYTVGSLFLKESPRWLFRRGRAAEAEAVLCLSRNAEQAKTELAEMSKHSAGPENAGSSKDSLLRRKYVVPFLIACIVLACTQATGINSILAYSAVILKGAGLNDMQATNSNLIITVLNCGMTLVGAMLIDRVGRKFLLKVGTAGIIFALVSGGLIYRQFESRRIDVSDKVAALITADGREIAVAVDEATFGKFENDSPGQLSVLYSYDDGKGYHRRDAISVFSNAPDAKSRVLSIKPKFDERWKTLPDGKREIEKIEKDQGKLSILRAKYGPLPAKSTGILITIIICLFISSFAIGPGVCVWLALTELMPTRIRSMGIGIAMLLNTGVQFLIALFFLPVVANHGFSAMFFFWAGCTVIYFITAAFFMPETKGKTLEEIEDYFEGK
jgi:MFS transporter, SP family, solute carrier family 2 (myo-inositol transporter), member 13